MKLDLLDLTLKIDEYLETFDKYSQGSIEEKHEKYGMLNMKDYILNLIINEGISV